MSVIVRLEPKKRRDEGRPLLTVPNDDVCTPSGTLLGAEVIVDDPATILHLYDNVSKNLSC